MNANPAAAAPGGTVPAPFLRSGALGLWVFLSSEIILFGGLIASYLIRRLAQPEWAGASAQLSVTVGGLNTFVLLTSSLTMVLALVAAEHGRTSAGRWFLLLTVVLGAGFLVVKGFEWGGKFAHGITPGTSGFWSFYFTMTGLHALHVLIGILINAVILLLALGARPLPARRLEAAGLYWHFVDVIWIFLFPLLYLS